MSNKEILEELRLIRVKANALRDGNQVVWMLDQLADHVEDDLAKEQAK
jgi:hypothetical protein